jgi:hypothetical protein
MATLTFTQALLQAEAQARSNLPAELHERLDSAVQLVRGGHAFQQSDGTWQVDSSTEGLVYTVNGSCHCDDVHYNKPAYCKHRLAMFLARRVCALMTQPSVPVVPAPDEEPEVMLPEPMEPYPDNDPDPAPAPPAGPVPLPEAPVSITLKATLHGHEVMVTLRGVDFASVKAQVEEASAWLKAHAPAPPTVPTEGFCAVHQVSMKQTTKEGRSWWSHKTPEGQWCKGR